MSTCQRTNENDRYANTDTEDPEEDGLLTHIMSLSDIRKTMSEKKWNRLTDDFRRRFYGPSQEDMSFPVKLYMVVGALTHSPFVFWSSDGNSFAVSRNGYEQYVMSTFFKQSKFKSFQNILHRYGFQTMTSYESESVGNQVIIYRHPCFRRGRQDLCQKIHIIESKPNKSKKGGGIKRKPSDCNENSDHSINGSVKQPNLDSTQGDNAWLDTAHIFGDDDKSTRQVTAACSKPSDDIHLSRPQSFDWSQGAIKKLLKDLDDAEEISFSSKGLGRLDSISSLSCDGKTSSSSFY